MCVCVCVYLCAYGCVFIHGTPNPNYLFISDLIMLIYRLIMWIVSRTISNPWIIKDKGETKEDMGFITKILRQEQKNNRTL